MGTKVKKKIVYIDLDGTIADFNKLRDFLKLVPCPKGESTKVPKGFFLDLELIEGAKKAVEELSKHYEVYFLSTPQWSNPDSYTEKRLWIEKYFGKFSEKRLILTHHKYLAIGDYLIDDRNSHGNERFTGELIHFGSEKFPTWKDVTAYLLNKEEKPFLNFY